MKERTPVTQMPFVTFSPFTCECELFVAKGKGKGLVRVRTLNDGTLGRRNAGCMMEERH